MEKEKIQEKESKRISPLKKILVASALTIALFTNCGCVESSRSSYSRSRIQQRNYGSYDPYYNSYNSPGIYNPSIIQRHTMPRIITPSRRYNSYNPSQIRPSPIPQGRPQGNYDQGRTRTPSSGIRGSGNRGRR